jgi:metal transporter CNNM
MDRGRLPLRSDDPDIRQHLKHLGPSNAATRPKSTRIPTVKIKPGVPGVPKTIPENGQRTDDITPTPSHAPHGGIGEGILDSAGREASDGVHSVAVGLGYGTMASDRMSWKSDSPRLNLADGDDGMKSPKSSAPDENSKIIIDNRNETNKDNESEGLQKPVGRTKSSSTLGSLHSVRSRSKSPIRKRHTARSGSISENIVESNGVKKMVLETSVSSDSEDKVLLLSQTDGSQDENQDRVASSSTESPNNTETGAQNGSKKKRKKRPNKKKKTGGESSESQPLLGGGQS